MYKAIDIASYTLNHYKDENIYITNLKLQKLLYFIQCEFIREVNELCFDDVIQAWAYGPVVPNVYYTYNRFVANEILDWRNPHTIISQQHKSIIYNITDKYKDVDAWDLVKMTHTQTPWKLTYKKGKKNIIPAKYLFNFVNRTSE
jgi:uncharacterized phage-associated protein